MRFLRALPLFMLATVVDGQWIKLTLPETPRLVSGAPDLDAPVSARDLSGIWQVLIPYGSEFDGTGRRGLRGFMPANIEIPLQPWAAELRKRRDQVDLGAGRPSERCMPRSILDSMFHTPFKIVQTPRLTIVLLEEFNFYRQIHTDGRTHPSDPTPAWFGYSVGTWEGDRFTVRTQGFKVGPWLDYGWMDDSGVPCHRAFPPGQLWEAAPRCHGGGCHCLYEALDVWCGLPLTTGQ